MSAIALEAPNRRRAFYTSPHAHLAVIFFISPLPTVLLMALHEYGIRAAERHASPRSQMLVSYSANLHRCTCVCVRARTATRILTTRAYSAFHIPTAPCQLCHAPTPRVSLAYMLLTYASTLPLAFELAE
eukprot:651624-Pleurochrysis_carterae.AAC.4